MRFIQYDEYEENLREETGYNQPEGRLVFLDNQHSQAVFLTNYLMQDRKLMKPIFDAIGVKGIRQFRIIIRNQKVPRYLEEDGLSNVEQSQALDEGNFFELTQPLLKADTDKTDFKIIDKLKACATTQFYDLDKEELFLDYFVDDDIDGDGELKKAFQFHFDNDPFTLFQAFQVLLTLNLYDVSIRLKKELYQSDSLYVTETVPTLPSDQRIMRFKELEIEKEYANTNIYSKSLSDGEHQYLHAMGICLLFKNTNSLFLLDEPETHLNPDWRAAFISTLRDCFVRGDEDQFFLRDLLITSHSPFIVSDCQEENVLVFSKNEKTGIVSCERPEFKTFGASINKITLKVFDKRETIGNYAHEILKQLYKRLEAGESKEKLMDEADNLLGDSIEKIIFINKALEKN